MLGGLLAYRRSKPILCTVLFMVGAITRETILLAPAAIAVTRLVAMARRQVRPRGPRSEDWARSGLAWPT